MPHKPVTNKMYRNISLTFIVFALMILSAIFLFFYSQAVVIVTPDSQDINLSFNVEIRENPTLEQLAEQDVVYGKVESSARDESGSFDVLSTKTVSSTEIGKVKLINNSASNQPLMQTTQLQAENGVIVRTSQMVTVPAGGSVEVSVYPKDPAVFSTIKSGKLTIIRLAAALQDKIYGEPIGELSNGPREVKVVSDGDVNRAREELQKKVTQSARQEFKLSENDPLAVTITEFKTDRVAGEEAPAVNYTAKVKISTIAINKDQLNDLIKRKVEKLHLNGLNINNIDTSNVKYSVIEPDPGSEAVMIKVDYLLKAMLAADNSILDRKNFVGKTIDEVRNYAGKSELIKNVEIHVSPYWQKHLPGQEGRIKVIVK